ncbi:MAG: TraB/GumN family protein [Sphingopyxis sp.]|nr:TraB/GumN family protein [Sphingopyxis sp.]
MSATPAMWEIADGDTRITIIGSVHLLPDHIDWYRGPVLSAANQADELWLELPPGDLPSVPALVARTSRDETVATLDRRLGADLSDQAEAPLTDLGIDPIEADRTESWMLSMAIGASIARNAGFGEDNGVENRLTAVFVDRERPVRGLETAREQLAIFDNLPPATQDAMLAATVRDMPNSNRRLQRLVTAWSTGDVDVLASIVDDEVAQLPVVHQRLVIDRNRAWANKIAAQMAVPGNVLVAVGAGHLAGPDSLLTMLEQRGVRVRRIH